MGLATAGTHRPEIVADAGVEGHLQRLATIQQYIIAWRHACPNSLQSLLKNNNDFLQKIIAVEMHAKILMAPCNGTLASAKKTSKQTMETLDTCIICILQLRVFPLN